MVVLLLLFCQSIQNLCTDSVVIQLLYLNQQTHSYNYYSLLSNVVKIKIINNTTGNDLYLLRQQEKSLARLVIIYNNFNTRAHRKLERPLPIMAGLLNTTKFLSTNLSRFSRLVSPSFRSSKASSSISYPLQLSSVSENHASIYNESLNNPEAFWGHLARTRLSWFKDFDKVLDCDMREGRLNWFSGGKINATGKAKSI